MVSQREQDVSNRAKEFSLEGNKVLSDGKRVLIGQNSIYWTKNLLFFIFINAVATNKSNIVARVESRRNATLYLLIKTLG